MLKIILYCIVLISEVFSFETLSIYNKSEIELLKQPNYLIGEMSHREAYKKCKSNDFLDLPEKAINSGYDHSILWICLELRKKTDRELYLSLSDASLSNVTFFKYENDKFIEENIQNIQNNSFDKYIPKISLEQSVLPVTYLIRIKSPLPYIISMLIANSSEILSNQLIEIIIFFTFIGIFTALLIYNIFLFFATKQNEYLLYSMIILFLVVWNFIIHGFFNIIFNLDHNLIHIIKTFSFIGISFFFLIFNFQFFNLKRSKRSFKFLLIALVPLYFIFLKIEELDQCISIYMLFVILTACISLSLNKYKNNYRPSKYYLIAVIGYFIGTLTTFLMFKGILTSNFFNLEANLIGTIWLMIFLALALGDRIKLLQLERNDAVLKFQVQEKMLFLQSKQASIGELVSNITHQWKEPLAEIGSIQTNMQAVVLLNNELSKEKLLALLEENNNIIRHLSDTIDVFYKLFKNEKSQDERINLLKIIQNIEKIMHYILEEEKIEFKYEIDEEIYIYGDNNEYTNVLLNILLNAKDALVKRKILNPWIKIIALKKNKIVKILIEDNAGGIKQKPISRIFESGITSKEDSIGIGLFITKTILEKRINGNIFVQNGLNGAIFTIECPSYKSEQLENKNNSFNIEETILNRINLLEKKLEKQIELEKSLKQWEDIFNQTHWGVIVLFGTSNEIGIVNPAFCEMYGYSKKEAIKMRIEDLFTKESLYFVIEKNKEALKKKFVSFETVSKKKNGIEIPINIDITVIKNENRDILYQIINIKNIAEDKKIQDSLQLKKFAMNQMGKGVLLINKSGNFTYVNQFACNLLGYSRNELLQLNIGEINYKFKKWNKYWEIIKKNKSISIEQLYKMKNGITIPVEMVITHFDYKESEYNLFFVRDISDKYKMKNEIKLLKNEIKTLRENYYI